MRRLLTCAAVALTVGVIGATVAGSADAVRTDPAQVRTNTGGLDYRGIARLSNCSASLVRWTSSRPGNKALVLTNGHCRLSGFIKAGTAIADRPSNRRVTLLGKHKQDVATIRAVRVVYGTMTGTDVLLYRMRLTYAQIHRRWGITALTVAPGRADPRVHIRIPSGYWKRTYRCDLNGYVYRLRESDWTWRWSLRYSDAGCKTIPGTSGSPVINARRRIVGINNTGNEDGRRCTLNNPCEVNRQGTVTVHPGRNYGQQTRWFYGCLTDRNQIDTDRSGCRLLDPR